MVEGERQCPTCKKMHKGEGLPPSLQTRLHLCVSCYKDKKKKSDQEWRNENKDIVKAYKRKYRRNNPDKTRQEWKDRTARWKENKRKRRANKVSS